MRPSLTWMNRMDLKVWGAETKSKFLPITWRDSLLTRDPFHHPDWACIKLKALNVMNTSDKVPHSWRRTALSALSSTSGKDVSCNYWGSLPPLPALISLARIHLYQPYHTRWSRAWKSMHPWMKSSKRGQTHLSKSDLVPIQPISSCFHHLTKPGWLPLQWGNGAIWPFFSYLFSNY